MMERTQVSVGLDNRPGMLAKLCRVLSSAQVNIEALCISDDTDCVWVNLVVTPADVAERVLTDAGYRFLSEQVLTLELANQPGELERVTAKLAEAGINISYVYGAGAPGTPCELVLRVDDAPRAIEVLGNSAPRD